MSNILEVKNVTKAYKDVTAVNEISFSIEENKIYGFLGRNGAGKTTIMNMITAQLFPTEGEIKVFGEEPYENRGILQKVCFIKESQAYPEYFRVMDVLATAASIYPNWDEDYAQQLVTSFQLPQKRNMKKLSRGMLSSVGIVVGLASRAPLTIFDEPYLGLDAVARSIFYDQLLKDYSNNPRTVILSTHLIDEVSQLLEHILVMDNGRLVMKGDLETLRGQVYTIVGDSQKVEKYIKEKEVLHQEKLGSILSATIYDTGVSKDHLKLDGLGLEYVPVSLQQAVIYLTNRSRKQGGVM
ncbi:ABC transporter ATP-binding protein [Shimazuella kribbensis]|uniref:ABC transporter ATP-binding protein n=1 Tax=Shimazuella kribbensis TaxID=139808 RepID=UPI000402379D|nr:ABC transporter ATP-binding protein [Shimazuella kribbensis]